MSVSAVRQSVNLGITAAVALLVTLLVLLGDVGRARAASATPSPTPTSTVVIDKICPGYGGRFFPPTQPCPAPPVHTRTSTPTNIVDPVHPGSGTLANTGIGMTRALEVGSILLMIGTVLYVVGRRRGARRFL